MENDKCIACGRPLTPEDKEEYCPHCTAKKAGKFGKTGSFLKKMGQTALIVIPVVFGAIRYLGKK